LQERYEIHHGVEITDPAIVAAARCRVAITDRFLPDKAIDLIDEGRGAIKMESTPSRKSWTGSSGG
jgi:ATP-dependent Clp protease ATP-binding subunit ClpB